MTAKAAVGTGTMTRRAAVGLAVASTLPLAFGGQTRTAAAKPLPETWMYAGNAARTGVFSGPGLDLTQEIVELWRIDQRQSGLFVDPCGVCDGIVYYLPIPDGISPEPRPLIAVEAATGTELWRHDPPTTEPTTYFGGEPAIAGGLLVMPTSSGLLVGMDARTGEERWVFDVQGTCRQSRPAIVDDVLYVSDMAAVNAVKLGEAPEWLWKTPLGDGTTTVVSGTVSADGDVVVASSLSPVAVAEELKITDIHVLNTADGAESYRFQAVPDEGESYQFAIKDGVIYSRVDLLGFERSFYYARTLVGTEMWTSRTTMDVRSYPAVSGDVVCGAAVGGVEGYDAATGQTVWKASLPETVDTDLVLIDDVVYIGAAPPTPLIYVLSASDGSLLTSIPVPFNGAQVIGVTDGILIARSGVNLVALANPR